MTDWESLLQKIINGQEFSSAIQTKGFYKSDIGFKQFAKKHGFSPDLNTPMYLSLDFWSLQPKILTENNFYILRSGRGTFAIIDETQFPRSYLNLTTSDYTQLEIKKNGEFSELIKAFDTRQENAGLEHLHVLGVYDLLIKELFGDVEWHIGPRGNKVSQFKVYGKKSSEETALLFDYHGQEELDYTLWTKDCILLFEAKSVSRNEGLDVGWHKMAYPASRFSKISNYTIKPIYFLKWGNIIHLFVFPKFQFYNDGIIINDKKNQIPEKIFRIDYSSTLQDFL